MAPDGALCVSISTLFQTDGHVYFVSIGPKIAKIFEKFAAIKSLLNPHFKGFGAITRSGFC